MVHFRFYTSALLVTVFLSLYFHGEGGVFAEEATDQNINFRWAFAAMVGPEGDRRLVAITRNTVLKSGDQLKMMLELKRKCYLYLFYQSGAEKLHMLFPYELKQFDTDYETSKPYYIPNRGMWFELDEQIGLEKFYLIASSKRLIKLEGLYTAYTEAASEKKKGLSKRILSEIKELRKKYRKFSTAAERPVEIAGSTREAQKSKKKSYPDIDPMAAEVSASHFYSRIFTIEHQ